MTDNGRRLAVALYEGMARLEALLIWGDLETYRREAPEWEWLLADAEARLAPMEPR